MEPPAAETVTDSERHGLARNTRYVECPREGGIVNEALLETFRHNGWATRQLIASCRGLSEEQLTSPATGTYGGILATLNHLVRSDGSYLRRLAGSAPAWVMDDESADLDQLEARV